MLNFFKSPSGIQWIKYFHLAATLWLVKLTLQVCRLISMLNGCHSTPHNPLCLTKEYYFYKSLVNFSIMLLAVAYVFWRPIVPRYRNKQNKGRISVPFKSWQRTACLISSGEFPHLGKGWQFSLIPSRSCCRFPAYHGIPGCPLTLRNSMLGYLRQQWVGCVCEEVVLHWQKTLGRFKFLF